MLKVRGSSTHTREVLKRHFQELQTSLSRLLNERLNTLLQEVDSIEQDSISPLDDCQKLIEHGVKMADELLREGETEKKTHLHTTPFFIVAVFQNQPTPIRNNLATSQP